MSLGARLHYSSENFDYWGIFTYNIELTGTLQNLQSLKKCLSQKIISLPEK